VWRDSDGLADAAARVESPASRAAHDPQRVRRLGRGYSEQDVKKILSGNFLRVIRQVIGR
jgi:Membrane dipeptidase (Peptidase family M19)